MNPLQRKIRNIVNNLGFDIIQFRPDQVGQDPIRDIKKFLHNEHPIIFDVGANIGQSLLQFHDNLPRGIIHSFEPSATTFTELTSKVRDYKNVQLWNCGLGSSSGHKNSL